MSVDFEIKDNYDINDFLRLVTVLRSPGGCPWDRKQTHESIKKNFIEETYEVVEAINKADAEGLKEELGDVLLQVAMHSEMESEKGSFDFNDVVNDICKKLVVRHPHVFGDAAAQSSDEALQNWDQVKLKTKGMKKQGEAMIKVPREFPALMRAQKVQEKAAKAGFDWDDINGAVDKLHEEIDELETALAAGVGKDIEEEFGDVLFSCVNVSRFIGADSEEALTASTDKFIKRYLLVEKLAADEGLDMKTASIEELDKLWNKAKIIIAEKAKTEEFK
ncbi:MAG: nucleoside triphosphate pyrophosphohydrolase [Clostridiales bacterium]|nr:nucleoside triphosphate pyrophosphohydrolase [Clostridiales bacterium]MBD8978674.1 nucleoside triphosphate pyrophosphohydrolase [Clostridiales bacterium]MBD8979360.1 nucleoside triphosphate pyrophosphohydrolase [Clostridiales bacterium]MEE0128641.1 nucleoside triphosphate pyrophosphohydrolase [Eubacterium sp.]